MVMTIMVMTMVMTIMMRARFSFAIMLWNGPVARNRMARMAHAVDRIAIRATIREAAKLLHGDTLANPPNHQREEPALE